MAHHKSAEKRVRSSKKRAQRNKRVLRSLKNCEKQMKKNLKDKNAKAIEETLKKLFKLSDRARNKGIIKKNTSNRKKSRWASKVSRLSP